jgi:hypothetical protein
VIALDTAALFQEQGPTLIFSILQREISAKSFQL